MQILMVLMHRTFVSLNKISMFRHTTLTRNPNENLAIFHANVSVIILYLHRSNIITWLVAVRIFLVDPFQLVQYSQYG